METALFKHKIQNSGNFAMESLKQLLLETIKISEIRGYVHGLVFDGVLTHLAMAHTLGCDITHCGGSFTHPSKEDFKSHVILDIWHMLKLTRNALAHMGTFTTPLDKGSNGIT